MEDENKNEEEVKTESVSEEKPKTKPKRKYTKRKKTTSKKKTTKEKTPEKVVKVEEKPTEEAEEDITVITVSDGVTPKVTDKAGRFRHTPKNEEVKQPKVEKAIEVKDEVEIEIVKSVTPKPENWRVKRRRKRNLGF